MRELSAQAIAGGSAVIGDEVLQIAEAAAVHACGRNSADCLRWSHDARALIIEEEEGLVSSIVELRNEHWPTDRSAKLVLTILGLRLTLLLGEVVVCVEGVVADVLPDIAVKLIGSGTDDRVDDAAGRVSEFCVVCGAGGGFELRSNANISESRYGAPGSGL